MSPHCCLLMCDGSVGMPATREESMGQLDGRVGIITGAASGIGAATARVLAREGAKLLLTDLDDVAGLALAESLGGVYVHHDVTDEAGWAGVIATSTKLSAGWTFWSPMPGLASWGRWSTCRWRIGAGRWRSTSTASSFRSSIVFPRCGAAVAAARSSCCLRWPGCAVRPAWRGTARRKVRCGCSPNRWPWNAPTRGMGYG